MLRDSAAGAKGGDVLNSIISWVGGKKALRDMIYQRMPKEFGRYIEVFGGGGWVLFGRPPDAAMEVYNDFNSDLANLFRCVRTGPLLRGRTSFR